MPAVNPRNIRSSGPPSLPKVIKDVLDPRPAISDAYWSATHPVDRIMGRGRAKGGQMIFPWGAKFPPKEYVVGLPEQGLKAVRLPQSKNVPLDEQTKDSLTWRGTLMRTGYYQERERGMPREFWDRENFRSEAQRKKDHLGRGAGQELSATAREVRNAAREEHGTDVHYNVIDKDGKIVGSSHFKFHPDKVHVGEIFLKPEVGKTPVVFKDLIAPAADHAMKNNIPIDAVAGNKKVGRLLKRMASKGKQEGRPGIDQEHWGGYDQRAQFPLPIRDRPSMLPPLPESYFTRRDEIAEEKGYDRLHEMEDAGSLIRGQLSRERDRAERERSRSPLDTNPIWAARDRVIADKGMPALHQMDDAGAAIQRGMVRMQNDAALAQRRELQALAHEQVGRKSSPEFHQTMEAGRNIQRAMRERAAGRQRRPLPRQITPSPQEVARAEQNQIAQRNYGRMVGKPQAERDEVWAVGERIQQAQQQRNLPARVLSAREQHAKEVEARIRGAQFATRQRAIQAARIAELERIRLARAQMLAAQRRAPNPIRQSRPGRGGV